MKKTKGEIIFGVFNTIFMLFLCVIMLYPYLNQLAISFNDSFDTMMGGITIFPRKPTLVSYEAVFSKSSFWPAAWISVSRVILCVVLGLIVNFMAAYALSRKQLPGKRGITLYLMIPNYITAGTIPIYIMLRMYGLINNYWVYIITCIYVFYYLVVIRSNLQSLPPSLEESAKIDGANDFQVMWKIIFPLSLPVVATVALWIAVAAWNDWTTTLYYVTDKDLYTLQYMMMKLIQESNNDAQDMLIMTDDQVMQAQKNEDSVKAATLIVTTVPIICVYPFLQKYFIKGVTVGAVKE